MAAGAQPNKPLVVKNAHDDNVCQGTKDRVYEQNNPLF